MVRPRPRHLRGQICAQELAERPEEEIAARSKILVGHDPDMITAEQLHVAGDQPIVLQMMQGESAALDAALDELAKGLRAAFVHVLGVDRPQHLVLPPDDDHDAAAGDHPVQPRRIPEPRVVAVPQRATQTLVGQQQRRAGQCLDLSQHATKPFGEEGMMRSSRQICDEIVEQRVAVLHAGHVGKDAHLEPGRRGLVVSDVDDVPPLEGAPSPDRRAPHRPDAV